MKQMCLRMGRIAKPTALKSYRQEVSRQTQHGVTVRQKQQLKTTAAARYMNFGT